MIPVFLYYIYINMYIIIYYIIFYTTVCSGYQIWLVESRELLYWYCYRMPVTWEWEPIFFITGLGGVVGALAMDLQWLTKIHNSYKCMHYLLYASTNVHRINHFTIQDLPYYTLSTSDGKFRSFYRMFIYRMVRMRDWMNHSPRWLVQDRPITVIDTNW